jgi:anaerobic magnesium-protoporphyrin IX monomethyl ester cyclase
MQILVAHSYFLRFDRKQFERGRPYPPLATLQVASMLREAGHQVRVFDAMLAEGIDEFRQQLQAGEPQLVLIYEDSFNYLSKMCLERMRQACCEMIAHAHDAGARVLVTGPDATDAPEPYLRAGAQAVLLGEALQLILTLSQRLSDQPQLSSLQWIAGDPGAVTLIEGVVIGARTGKGASPRAQIDQPAWDLIDVERYREMWQRKQGFFSLNMAASRGCSFRCSWCAKPIWGNRYLQREPEEVAAEMQALKRRFRPDHIWFADDIWGFRTDWVARFTQALQAGGGGIPFTIQTRADLISVAMAQGLAAAGCTEAWIGAESGSQRILDAMNKGTTVDEIVTARSRLQASGIRVGFFIQLGYLGEELEDLLATRALIEQAVPDEIGVSVSYPLPGTPFYDQVKRQLGAKTHWKDSNDLAMMFHGTYVSDFYRRVRDLLHERVRAGRIASDRGEERRLALQSLHARWDSLLAREYEYRFNDQSELLSCIAT